MDNKKLADQMGKNLGNLMNQAKKMIKNMPEEVRIQLPSAHSDLSKIQNALKTGDFSVITDIQKKYANTTDK